MSSFRFHSSCCLSLVVAIVFLCSCGVWSQEVLVKQNSLMVYQDNTSATGVDGTWFDEQFYDSEWLEGQYGVGYDTNGDADALLQTTVGDYTRSVYTRAYFTVAGEVTNVFLGVDFDDGYVAWIDGVEVYRDNMPSGDLVGDSNASVNHESSNGSVPNHEPLRDISAVAADLLIPGDHVLAIGVWNIHGTSSDLVLVPRLSINEPTEIIKGPYLQNVGLDHITVMWETSTESPSRVDYGATQEYGQSVGDPTPVTIHEVTLTGLVQATQYTYKVTSGDVSSLDNTFWTAMTADTAFRFVAYGDSRDGSDNYEFHQDHWAVVNAIIASDPDPDFVLHTGDIVYNGGNYGEWGPQFFAPAADLMKSTTMFPSIGNHEYNRDATAQTYRDLFSLPSENERWYSFDYGNSHFICLDDNSVSYYQSGTEQYNWLVSDLQWATDPNNPNPPQWIFVFFHIPPYTCVDNHSDDTDVQRELVPLFEEYGVTMVFNGHSHAYERYFHNGVYYIVTGGGGAPLSNLINDNKEPIRQVGSSVRHHCVIDVATDTLTFVALDNSGNDFDSLFLEHTPPNPPENLVAVAGTEEVSLYWDENLETDIAGYNVYRSETSGSGYAKINDGLVTAIEYLDTDVVGGTTYYYVVTAMDTSGNESGASNEASAMPEADYDAYVSQDPIVTYGTVGGNGIAGTVAAGDGLVQTITEVPNGTAGMASLEVEYVLHTTANPAEVAELVLYLDANWTELDADPLLVSIYDGSGYEDITAAIQSGSFTPASQPQNYVNVDGNISVLFTDTEPIRKEKKDTLTIDLLYAHILAGPPDTEPPAPPEGLTATAGDTIVDLDWDDNTEPDRDGYYVYRSESESGTYSLITTQAVSPSFYQDTGLANGVTYYYKVSAVDFSGNPSALSEPPASATPVDLPPSAPTGLVATPGNGKVTLDWDDNPESDLDGYNVYRRTASGSYDFEAPLTTVADSADVDNSVANGTTYYYVVTAVDEAEPPNESEISNEASAIPSESQTVHVKSIAMALESAGKNWKAVATVLIHDQSSTAQSGAVVFGDWYLNGKSIQTGASGTTDGSGYAVLTSPPRKAKSGETFTFTVTDVVLTGFVYDPSDNVETTDSIPVE